MPTAHYTGPRGPWCVQSHGTVTLPAKYTHSPSGPLRAGSGPFKSGRGCPPAPRWPRSARPALTSAWRCRPPARMPPSTHRQRPLGWPPASATECVHDGQVRPAAALLRRRRWISDHCRTILVCRILELVPVPGVDLPGNWNRPRTTTAAGAASGSRTTVHSIQPELRRSHSAAVVGSRDFAATVVRACASGPRPTRLQTTRRAGFPTLTHGTTTAETCRACS